MRIDKVLSNLKYCSRKEAKKFAKEGLITVNGEVIKDVSKHIDPTKDALKIGHQTITYYDTLTLMMNKRKGVVSANHDDLHPTVFEDLPTDYQRFDLNIAGRLDLDTEGLIVLSTDGKLIHDIISPSKSVYKTYEVFTDKPVDDIEKLKEPMSIEDGKGVLYTPATPIIRSQNKQRSVIQIKEGKFHQVKRMYAYLGYEVIALKRIAIGNLLLDETLKPGMVKVLEEDDINALKNL